MIAGTWLFVPGDRPDRFAKAAAAGADGVILDLEDGVSFERKDEARDHVRAALEGGFEAIVRVNPPGTSNGVADLEMLAALRARAVMVPKVADAGECLDAGALVRGLALLPLIETVAGMSAVEQIAAAPAVTAIAFGAYDFSAELGARPARDVLAPYRARVVLAARNAGITALDSPYAELDDADALRGEATWAAACGFDGKLAIHPKQVAVLNDAFRPTPEELAAARATIEAGERHGAVRRGSEMIDAAMVAAARRVIARSKEN